MDCLMTWCLKYMAKEMVDCRYSTISCVFISVFKFIMFMTDSFEGEELLKTPIKKGKKTFIENSKPTPLSESQYHDALIKKTLKAVHRKGKQLWFEMVDSDVVILFHFGMTGSFVIENEAAPSYKSFRVRNEHWPPKFAKLEIIFANKIKLAFCDPRRLGRIRLRTDPMNSSPIKELGIGKRKIYINKFSIILFSDIFVYTLLYFGSSNMYLRSCHRRNSTFGITARAIHSHKYAYQDVTSRSE